MTPNHINKDSDLNATRLIKTRNDTRKLEKRMGMVS